MAILTDIDAITLLGLDADDTLLPVIRAGAERRCKTFLEWDPERSAKTEYYPLTERGGASRAWPGEWGGHPVTGGRTGILRLKRGWVLASGLVVQEFSGAYAGQNDDTSWDTLTLGDDYALDLDNDNLSESGHVVRLGGDWPKTRASVKVTYTAGFTATELSGAVDGSADYTDASDIRLAVIETVAKFYNEIKAQQKQSGRPSGPLTMERVPDYQYQMDHSAARQLLGMSTSLPASAVSLLTPYSKGFGLTI